MGDGTKKNPYTREDVLIQLEEYKKGGKKPKFSEKYFEKCIDLHGLPLQGIDFNKAEFLVDTVEKKGANLEGAYLSDAQLKGTKLILANLKKADLRRAHLESADLREAHLEGEDKEGIYLDGAHLEGANLRSTKLEGAFLWIIKFNNDTDFTQTNWGKKLMIGEEKEGDYIEREKRKGDIKNEDEKSKGFYSKAKYTYLQIKTWYTNKGMLDVAGKFFYREMESKRKLAYWNKKEGVSKLGWLIVRLLCGYGENPERVIMSAALVILLASLFYFGLNSWSNFGRSLYFSAVSFSALGYGSWTRYWFNTNMDCIIGLGAAESFLGFAMIALFALTITRKMTR